MIQNKLNNLVMHATTSGTSGYAPNWMNKYEISEVPSDGHEPNLVELAAGIQTVEPSSEEETEEIVYYSHRGGKESDVTSISFPYTFTGHRDFKTDPAQQLVRNKLTTPGNGRKVYFRHTEPDGRVLQGIATLSGIVHGGGDANNRGNFECVITFDGIPEDILPEGAIKVEKVELSMTTLNLTVDDVTTLTSTITPPDAVNSSVSWSSSNTNVATVVNGEVTAISEGSSSIIATAGGISAICLVEVAI